VTLPDSDFARGSGTYRHLFGVAYRMLGSVHDAEDAVQEGLVRWQDASSQYREQVREPVAWLTRVVSRICLDQLGSARVRRESYSGIWLPEPIVGASFGVAGGAPAERESPEDVVTLDESVSIALLTAMEQLTPAERVSLILHDVFGVPFGELADIVGRTPEACRRLASSARRNLRATPRFDPQGDERDRVVAAFARACSEGDMDALALVLDPSVVSRSDGGGKLHVAKRAIVGVGAVSTFLLGVLSNEARKGRRVTATLEPVNGRSGLVVRHGTDVTAVIDLAVRHGRVVEIAIVVNPDKLAAVDPVAAPAPPQK
jgi:RNA polymerase sigma-70 factor (ECF subfamily)